MSNVQEVPPVPEAEDKKKVTQKRLNPPAGGFTEIPDVPKGYATPKKKDFANPIVYLQFTKQRLEEKLEKVNSEISIFERYGGDENALKAAKETSKVVEKFQGIDMHALDPAILEALQKQIEEAKANVAG